MGSCVSKGSNDGDRSVINSNNRSTCAAGSITIPYDTRPSATTTTATATTSTTTTPTPSTIPTISILTESTTHNSSRPPTQTFSEQSSPNATSRTNIARTTSRSTLRSIFRTQNGSSNRLRPPSSSRLSNPLPAPPQLNRRSFTGFITRYSRRWHNVANSKYLLPNDDEEMDRLLTQHYMLRYVWGNNYSAPVIGMLTGGGGRILEIGCGPAFWTLEMATSYPHSFFTGIDMVAVYPSSIKPQNVTFTQSNILDGLPYDNDKFDYVYQRFLVCAYTTSQWENEVINEIVRVLKKGGWIEVAECDGQYESMGPVAKQLSDAVATLLRSYEMDPYISESLRNLLAKDSHLTDVNTQEMSIPVGSWGGNPGKLAQDNLIAFYKALKTPLSDMLRIPLDSFDELMQSFSREVDLYRTRWISRRVYARKI